MLLLLALVSLTGHAQNAAKIVLNLKVTGSGGEAVAGATVRSEADNVSVVTDTDGRFSLECTSGSSIAVSAPGYATQILTASADLSVIALDRNATDPTVPVAYRNIGVGDLSPGVSFVNMPELLDKNYITYSLDNMEGFAEGFHGNLWGMDQYLLLVDGVPRDARSVLPTEIAQVTFLKSAAAVALYGSRGAKGVVQITTKRGVAHEPRVTVRFNAGVHTPKRYPKFLGSAEYMSLYNEARVNDGLGELYTPEDIYHHAAGTNPYRYSNVDYYSSEYLKKAYGRYDGTFEMSGGNDRARYYTNVGYVQEGSVLDFGEASKNKNQRVNVRGNVDVTLNKFMTARVDAAAIYETVTGVNVNYWTGASTLRPNRFTPLVPVSMIDETDTETLKLVKNSGHLIDGQYMLGGTQLDQTNPIAGIYAGGRNTVNNRQFQFNTGVDANLESLLKGLSFNSLFGIDYSTTYNLSFNNNYAVFQPSWTNYSGEDQIASLTKYGQDASTGEQNLSNSSFRQTFSFSGGFKYQTSIQGIHNISAMLIAGGFQQAITGQYHKVSNVNAGLYAGYNYKGKYYVDFNGALVHSARLPANNRRAFSPTLSLSWRLKAEDFMADLSAIDDLRLFVSGGILHTDLDIPDYYLYEGIYRQTDGVWYTWRDGLNNYSTDVRRGANPDMKFPKREEVTFGLISSFFDHALTFRGNVFASKMKGIVVQTTAAFPSYFQTGYPNSSFLPYGNYNDDTRVGFDFNLGVNQRIGDVGLSFALVGTYYDVKASKRVEIAENDYQRREGKSVDGIWGLENLGFFKDQTDIDNSPRQVFGDVKPGDLKYKDQNGDKVINAQDEVFLGRGGWSGAPWTVGLNITATWKNFSLFVLGMARTGAYAMKTNDYFWVNAEDKYSEIVRGRWTEQTKESATYPRLTTQNGNNNFRNSDFWTYSTSRFDLARVQLSYKFPEALIGKGAFSNVGIYLAGANLFTIAPEREILETNIDGAPQTRFYNVGLRASF